MQQLALDVETKTKDNVVVKIPVSVQHHVIPEKVYEAFYKLANPKQQISSYVFNVILGHVPKMILDDAFLQQSDIAVAIKEGLDDVMRTYGYAIDQALVTDIEPDEKVKAAMNDINAAQREQVAASARGEAEKILKVKQAEAEAQSKALQGQGIANQRKAIIEGLKDSVEAFSKAVEGSTPHDVMMLVLVTQYLDTMKEIGANDKSNIIFMSHSPAAIGDLFRQMQDAVMIGQSGRRGQPVIKDARPIVQGSAATIRTCRRQRRSIDASHLLEGECARSRFCEADPALSRSDRVEKSSGLQPLRSTVASASMKPVPTSGGKYGNRS